MSKPEFRVRPVIRHVVTRYTPSEPLPDGAKLADGPRGGLETLGEFDSEGYAEIVKEALAERVAPREYVIVEQTMGEFEARVTFAYDENEAMSRLASEQAETGKTYRVYSRIVQRPD